MAMVEDTDTVEQAAHLDSVCAPSVSTAGRLEQDTRAVIEDHASGTRCPLSAYRSAPEFSQRRAGPD